ncbi:MAG: hypothetical protein HQL18_02960 [Candidatus Omnitrophica bacterium]|nr:hypothetical protein [Candidatus Omnitrophota bacterium]
MQILSMMGPDNHMYVIVGLVAFTLLSLLALFLIYMDYQDLNEEILELKKGVHMPTDSQAQDYKARCDQLKGELEKLKAEQGQKSSEKTAQDQDFRQLADELQKAKLTLQEKAIELEGREEQIGILRADLARMKDQGASASAKAEEVKAKDYEIERLTTELKRTIDHGQEMAKVNDELAAANQQLQALKAELAVVQSQQTGGNTKQAEALAASENEIKRLIAELERATAERKVFDENVLQMRSEQVVRNQQVQALKSELANLQVQHASDLKLGEVLATRDEEIKRLTAEIQRLGAAPKVTDQRLAKLKENGDQVNLIERTLDEEKKALHEMKLRMQEAKMKFELLNEKTRDAVEMVAQFAQGKEFDEFRKSIHMDEMIRKYEDEVKGLKIKVLDLEKKG